MHTYHVLAGESITGAIVNGLALAAEHNDVVQMDFNELRLTLQPGDDPASIEAQWRSEMYRRADEYRNSPEGRQAAVEAEARRTLNQSEVNRLMASMSGLQSGDYRGAIEWLDQLFEHAESGVDVPVAEILATLEERGFEVNVNTGPSHDSEDEENSARYLIGQVMDCLRAWGAIPEVYATFSERWRRKFAAPLTTKEG